MGAIFERAFSEQRLLDAWERVRESSGDDGHTSPEVAKFEEEAARHVSELARALADGSFEPRPVMRVEIAKPDGGTRRLAVPSVRDRVVERALLAELDPVIDPLLLPWSFAYRRGLGVRDAIAQLAEARDEGAQWVARCDIEDCFDRIPRWAVVQRLREVVPDPVVVDLIRRFMDRPVVKERTPYSERGLGLHQGSPLSPLLCNLYLDAFDRRMLTAGYRVVRFADDIGIPVPDRGAAERALSDASRELASLRLELNAAKTQVISFDDGVPFLGETVTSLTSPGRLVLSHPYQAVVYVDRPGTLLRSRGDRLLVEHGEETLFRLNFKRIRQIVCTGRVGMTTPFLHRSIRDGIDVVFIDEYGGPGGRIASLAHTDPTVRRAQYKAADDETITAGLARAFIDGKIANMRTSLLRAGRTGAVPKAEVVAAAETLAGARLALRDIQLRETLLGHEGIATRQYFRVWRQIVGEDWAFAARERRPPPDPVNAMLSFGYTILTHEVIAAAEMAGLDPAVGFIHQARWGRPCLALDLIEEFRPLIVDMTVLTCVTKGVVRFEEFETVQGKGCRMKDRARRAFLAAYERRMLTRFTHEPTGRRVSYRVGLGLQAKILARAILDSDPGEYRAVKWK